MNDGHDLNELLTDREQLLMAAWTLPNTGPLTDVLRRQAMANFESYRKRHNLNYADVGRQVAKPKGTCIRDLVKGVFTKDSDEHIRTLNMWVEQHARQQAVRLPNDFVSTRVANDILLAGRMVRENKTMGLAVGPTGIGKSRCAQALRQRYVGSILVTPMFGSTHPKGLTSVLADCVGVRTASKSQNDLQHLSQIERVVARLKDSNRLIIIDEAHNLTNGAIELLRQLHDATGCPVLLLATKDLQDRIDRTADPDHGQLYSRFDITIPLTLGRNPHAGDGNKPLFSIDDIRKLYEQPPIRLAPDAAKLLQDVANHLGYGSLRRCRILLTNAARRARKRQNKTEDQSVLVARDDLEFVELNLRQSGGERHIIEDRRNLSAAVSA